MEFQLSEESAKEPLRLFATLGYLEAFATATEEAQERGFTKEAGVLRQRWEAYAGISLDQRHEARKLLQELMDAKAA